MQAAHRTFPSKLSKSAYVVPAVQQVAALCWREKKDVRQVLLIKSSRGRWILPKGWPMKGRTDAKAAKIEAWEEAGVRRGKVAKKPIGRFLTEKRYEDDESVACIVDVYPVAVSQMTKSYPEADQRKRRWVTVKKAIKLVEEPGLRELLRSF